MKRNHIAALFFLVSLMAASCNKLTNGTPVEELRPVGPFHIISIYNNVNVKLVKSHQDNDCIKLTCPENLIEHVTTEISGDTLIIKNKNKLNWLRSFDYSIDMIVPFDSLREINYASIGSLLCKDSIKGIKARQIDTIFDDIDSTIISIDTLFPYTFSVNINEGSGDIDLTLNCDVLNDKFGNGTSSVTFRGTASYSEHATRSYGLIHAEELCSNHVAIDSESTNDVYVWAKTGLKAFLYNIGNVYYRGEPTITKKCHNRGNVYPIP